MTNRASVRIVAYLIAFACVGTSAYAQAPLRLAVAAGHTPVAAGNNPAGYSNGIHAQISVDRDRAVGLLGLRADVFVHTLRRETFGGQLSANAVIPGGALTAVLPLTGLGSRIAPYLLAGGGTYLTEYGAGQELHFGLNAGGGLRIGVRGVDLVAEARLHSILDGSTPRLVPISLGMRF